MSDYLLATGQVKEESIVRPEIAFNGRQRPLHWVNKKLVNAIDAHLSERVERSLGVTNRPAAYRGLDPDSGLFVSGRTGEALKVSKQVKGGKVYYSAEQVSALIIKLFNQAGIEGASALSVRRSLGVKLNRQGIDLRHIGEILGMTSLKAIKQLCETDPVKLGDLIRRII